jgi:hypothetical protein
MLSSAKRISIERKRVGELIFYKTNPLVPQIKPGRPDRAWMNATPDRYAYRCLPLNIANSLGWELLLPCRVEAEWNGGLELEDLQIEIADATWRDRHVASSHFGSGILTFQVGYVVRTEAGTGLLARGVPNLPKDGIAPLEGFVETDWLPFTFTMNWQFTRPGRIVFEEGEPFCFLMPCRPQGFAEYRPEIVPIAAAPELAAEYKSWAAKRREFNGKLLDEDPAIVQQAWQKWYTLGQASDGSKRKPDHLTKLALASPLNRDGGARA